jgi:RNA polymerase sigma factor (sigma-70 family)
VNFIEYDKIEELVLRAKAEDKTAKEALAEEFKPFILKLSKHSHINSYEFSDIENECYKTLFKCVNFYNTEQHRFVAYATNAIKNSVTSLIRSSVRRSPFNGNKAFKQINGVDDIHTPSNDNLVDIVTNKLYKEKLKYAVKDLNPKEQELLDYVYLKGYSLNRYSKLKGLSYYSASSCRDSVLRKLKAGLNSGTGYKN